MYLGPSFYVFLETFFKCYMQTQFTWDPQHDVEVKRECQKLTRVRLKDMVSKAAKEPLDKIITWMTDDIRASLKYMTENDEEFKKRYKRNKKNKVKGPKVKIGHSQRSSHLQCG